MSRSLCTLPFILMLTICPTVFDVRAEHINAEDAVSKAIARLINNETCFEHNNITECDGGRITDEAVDGYVLKDIFDLCPYSEICHRGPKVAENVVGACCGTCSCSDDCGLTNRCCFKSTDKYNLIQRNRLTCIKPYNSNRKSYSAQKYLMVDNCFEKDLGYTKACRFVDGTETLHPVTSSSSGRTYYNERCAVCNEVFDTIKWRQSLICPRRSLSSLNLGIELALRSNDCIMQFYPPSDENMTILPCGLMINDCNDPSLKDLCHSINLSFLDYANVFCYLCALNYKVSVPTLCGSATVIDTHAWLTGILDFTLDIKSSDLIRDRRVSKVCGQQEIFYSYKNTCLPIFCPEGMIKIKDTCHYIDIVMRRDDILSLQLRLRPLANSTMEASSFDTLNATYRQTPLKWMTSACIGHLQPAFFSIFALRSTSTNPSDSNIPVISVAVRMEFEAKGRKLVDIVDAVKNVCLIDNGWTIHFDDMEFEFAADLDFYFVISSFFPKKDPGQSVHMSCDIITSSFMGIASRISRLNFCQQIQLHKDEIDVTHLPHRIFILPSRYEIGSNSFAYSKDYIRMCLEDFEKATALSDDEATVAPPGGAANTHVVMTVSAFISLNFLLLYITKYNGPY